MLKNLHILLLAALCVGILSAAAPTAHAAEFREKGTALIEGKAPNALAFDGHGFKYFVDRYMRITSLTRFYDENGLSISLANLKIPCQAQIHYRRNARTGVPEAISVNVDFYREDKIVDTRFNMPSVKFQESD
jgi:hypothetical protein